MAEIYDYSNPQPGDLSYDEAEQADRPLGPELEDIADEDGHIWGDRGRI